MAAATLALRPVRPATPPNELDPDGYGATPTSSDQLELDIFNYNNLPLSGRYLIEGSGACYRRTITPDLGDDGSSSCSHTSPSCEESCTEDPPPEDVIPPASRVRQYRPPVPPPAPPPPFLPIPDLRDLASYRRTQSQYRSPPTAESFLFPWPEICADLRFLGPPRIVFTLFCKKRSGGEKTVVLTYPDPNPHVLNVYCLTRVRVQWVGPADTPKFITQQSPANPRNEIAVDLFVVVTATKPIIEAWGNAIATNILTCPSDFWVRGTINPAPKPPPDSSSAATAGSSAEYTDYFTPILSLSNVDASATHDVKSYSLTDDYNKVRWTV